MKKILIIADDLTGAAEIGGIAVAHGLTATIRCGQFQNAGTDAIVIDTDTRHLAPEDAVRQIQSILNSVDPSTFDLIYKKTDSMMRGPVAAELSAALSSLHFRRALFVPQNPSRNRIIRNSHYYIDNIPLDQSPVAADIEHPPTTAKVRNLLDPQREFNVHCISTDEPLPPKGITVGEAASAAEVHHWATTRDAQTLAAGGADFFTATMKSLGLTPITRRPFEPNLGDAIVVFGSASSHSRGFVDKLAAAGSSICDINPASLSLAEQDVSAQLKSTGHAFIAARCEVRPDRAEEIRKAIANLIATILSREQINTLFIEGGSTAAAIIRRLDWTDLQVIFPLHPGIVAIRPAAHPSTVLILKPGTYPWPCSLLPKHS